MRRNKVSLMKFLTLRTFLVSGIPVALLFIVGCSATTPVYDGQFGDTLQSAKNAQRIQSDRQSTTIDPQVGSNEVKGSFDTYVRGGVSASQTATTATSPSAVR